MMAKALAGQGAGPALYAFATMKEFDFFTSSCATRSIGLPRSASNAATRQTAMRTRTQHAAMRSPPAPPRRREDCRGAVERRVAATVERRQENAGVVAQSAGLGGHCQHGQQSGNGESHNHPVESPRLVLPRSINITLLLH